MSTPCSHLDEHWVLHPPVRVQVQVLGRPQQALHSRRQPAGPTERQRPGLKGAGARRNSVAS